MSSFAWESEDDQFGSEGEDDSFNDTDDDSDDDCKFENTNRLQELCRSISGKIATSLLEVQTVDIPSNYPICLGMGSQSNHLATVSSVKPLVDDSLPTYLTSPLLQKVIQTGGHSLTLDSTADESGAKSLSTSQLYVGNVSNSGTGRQLADWFIRLGYGVSYVDLKKNKKGDQFAFIRFDSIATATTVLHQSAIRPTKFVFKDNQLKINRSNRPSQQLRVPPTFPTKTNDANFEITDVYYGALLTGAAMRNIHHEQSNNLVGDKFGIIAHRLVNETYKTSSHFNIDMDKKKLAILVQFHIDPFFDLATHRIELKLEWNFQDLKVSKISPVIINQNEIFLLVEVKRSPIILKKNESNLITPTISDEMRLPASGLIGHANAWLFRLSSNLENDYAKLFDILYRHNLCQRQFSPANIRHSVKKIEAARKLLNSVQLISNEDWIKTNQNEITNFLQHRWPSYPFETKFEIMKLISKHIITVYDLIVDEQAEDILKMCTINTLVALTDKIVECAPQWFSNTCDNDEEEEEAHEQQAEPEEDNLPDTTEEIPTTMDDSPNSSHIRLSTTGASVRVEHTEIQLTTTVMKKSNLGTFSRLLIYALQQLLKKHELCRIKNMEVYATRLEVRTANVHPSLIRKIYITPSTILYEGPYREEKCAVTRQFEKYHDRFLRVTFRDEDYRTLHDYNDNMAGMYDRIKKILMDGVKICDRHYQFLAFSSSQLREHSCWMFASIENGETVDTTRAWMGDFQNVRPVAKLAARVCSTTHSVLDDENIFSLQLGQSFSTSTKGLRLESQQFKEIPDVIKPGLIGGRSRSLCFTDGIGIISPKFARKLAEQIHLSDKSACPSAFQIRCGGYKGMVCQDINHDLKYPDVDVVFRPSMNKFAAKDFSIDIIRTSLTPSSAYLNRQIILLLTSLGISPDVFMTLQQRMLIQLKELTEDPEKSRQTLRDFNEYGGNGYHKFLIGYLTRFERQKDPFVQQLLLAFKAFLLKELRTRAKIRVPDSWCLLGVVDESETLKYGQVFIQIDNTHQQRDVPIKEIFQGPVIVTRSPCFHPGDIRKLEAVDVPHLHTLKNVIVFPMNGPRPHAMEMSGGDLDGDTFWISRCPDLIFPRNEEPFDYQSQEDEAKEAQPLETTQYTIKNVCNFFGEYIAVDNLGLIANSHLVFADKSSIGAYDWKCLQLARMHSVAVDFAKNGVSAPRLTRDLRPQEYPHYMEKRDKLSYKSTTILCQLYDMIESHKMELHMNQEDEDNIAASFPYQSFLIDGMEQNLIKEARANKANYDRDIKRVMRQYGIEHEVEFVSGYILKLTSKQYAKETKLFDLRNEISHAYRVIQDKYLCVFWQEFYQSTDEVEEDEKINWSEISKKIKWKNQLDIFDYHTNGDLFETVKQKASAWFQVTYRPWMSHVERNRKNKSEIKQPRFKGLFSFAWLVYPVLWKIFEDKGTNSQINTGCKRKRNNKKKKNQYTKKKKD